MTYILLVYFLGLLLSLQWIKVRRTILSPRTPNRRDTQHVAPASRLAQSNAVKISSDKRPRVSGGVALAVAAFIFLPALLARNFAPPADFTPITEKPARDARIIDLLEGERLSSPAALPPHIFEALEVERTAPGLENISRDWALLDSDFRQRLLTAFTYLREHHGYHAVLIEGYRSPERQRQLASSGRQVTHADAYMSYHQHGLAADFAFLRDGRIVISEQDPWAMRGYALLGEIAEATGLTWGGRWSLKDYGHVELRRPARLAKRQTGTSSL